jgi:hypothetical protein
VCSHQGNEGSEETGSATGIVFFILYFEAGESVQLLKLRAGQPIHLPQHLRYRPDPACLRWHRERHGFSL